jgi:acyl-CoA synthetase (AMP-forming)/AMP-acid ligase II
MDEVAAPGVAPVAETGPLQSPEPVVHFGPAFWLLRNARHRRDVVCLIDLGQNRALTFGEFNERVNRAADRMRAAGAVPGDRVMVISTDNHQFAETWLACLKAGLTCVPVNVRLAPQEIAVLMTAANPSLAFVDPGHATRLSQLLDQRPDLVVVRYGAGAGPGDYEPFISGGSAAEPPVVVAAEQIGGLSFTSGTTGRPKGVLQSVRMLTNLALSRLLNYPPVPGEYWYTASPLFHVAGLASLLAGLAAGYTSILTPRFEPAATLQLIRDKRLNVCFLVPTMITDLLAAEGAATCDYSGLRAVIYGAAPMTPTLLRRAVATLGCEFVQLFGAGTESGLQCSLSWADHQRALRGDEHLLGSVGRPGFGVELRLCDADLNDVAPGDVGEIAVRSGMLMSGYLGMPAETAQALRDGWFRAGDLARMDSEGYLYLAGRRSDMIIRGGENVYPNEIEAHLSSHEKVREVAVVGVPDERWGETVHAFVVTIGDVTEDELRRYARAGLASYKVPERIHFRPELPRNASGKIDKNVLRGPAEA